MEETEGSPPSTLCMIRAAELFPKPSMQKEDEELIVPFQELAGESVKYLGRTDDGILALSNYRLFLLKNSTCSETSIPLGLIESIQIQDLFHLLINCKDASTMKCSFETAEQCTEWQRRITLSTGIPENLESLFAFQFYAWKVDSAVNNSAGSGSTTLTENDLDYVIDNNIIKRGEYFGLIRQENRRTKAENEWSGYFQKSSTYESDFKKEAERLQFDLNGTWRKSSANADFKLCPSYPPSILVPCCISDETLHTVANFRSSRRLPTVVWRHKQSGAVIARSSQPEVGWLGWRSSKDEQLLKALADACAFDRGELMRRLNLGTSGESTPSSAEGSHEEIVMDEIRKILIVDARSYTSAVTNRARGGGCECIEYYPCAEIQFMNLGNIHAIRKSFHALRQLCASPPDIPNWLGLLERTMWLQHLSGLLAASMTVCHAIEKKGRPVLVHCSDGWDRTPQIVATAELCLDPYYRTIEGFRILVEREWLNFGHKFADRCGHGAGSDDLNERCPVFLQWLDLVHQIHRQFPCSFEFNMAYLIKLAQHSHSCLFGTFLCNSLKERLDSSIPERTFSVWPFLSGHIYRNPLYVSNKEKVLWPAYNVRDLALWSDVYLGNLNSAEFPAVTNDRIPESASGPMTKTRSYGDLISLERMQNRQIRRLSDPYVTVDTNSVMPINHSNTNSNVYFSPSFYTNIVHKTAEKLEDLTSDLNQSSEQIYKINDEEATTVAKLNYNIGEANQNSKYVEKNINEINVLLTDKKRIGSEDAAANSLEIVPESSRNRYNLTNGSRDVSDAPNIIQNPVPEHVVNLSNECDQNLPTNRNELNSSFSNIVEEEAKHKNITARISTATSSTIQVPRKESIILPEVHCKSNSTSHQTITTEAIKIEPSNLNFNNFQNGEDIFISSDHKKLEKSSFEKCDAMSGCNNYNNHTKFAKNSINANSNSISNAINYGACSYRKFRASLPNYKNNITNLRNGNASTTNTKYPGSSFHSTPLPQDVSDRTQITIPSLDGLAHALSESNIRLQQIVYEQKLKENALLRELHAMRLALLKKDCPRCSNQLNLNDEQNSALDSVENNSILPWEINTTSNNVISSQRSESSWVADQTITKCTGCQTEFWLGRRKYRCRSCGQIFCADCSEYWAPFSDEKFHNSVRLCGSCNYTQRRYQLLQSQVETNLNGDEDINVAEATPTNEKTKTNLDLDKIASTSMMVAPLNSCKDFS